MLSAQTHVTTARAERYLKALCNHFSRKVQAEHTGTQGTVQFGFATCEMAAEPDTLVIHVQAENAENFARVKAVVGSHLEQFSANSETLLIQWVDQA
ncbi:MAG: DUF2218 domain-containing protein [Anaerolineae bacterium]|nr:DUF2218 domain-containing protein [Anaerolineae bacterium]